MTNLKRQRAEGGTYHDPVPLHNDFSTVHARDTEVRRVGSTYRIAPSVGRQPQLDPRWNVTESWAPIDDTEYSLDPDGGSYDAEVEADIMGGLEGESEEPLAPPKKKKSQVARRSHVVWKELHRTAYLDEIMRWAGRADFLSALECPDCVARRVTDVGLPEYRCLECFLPDLVCSSCCVKRHRAHPFHHISKWTSEKFMPISLKEMGLKVQLNHASMFCLSPKPCHTAFLVLHTNGIHSVNVQYCGCARAIPHHLQLLRRQLYPASQLVIQTCVTFQLLDQLHKLALSTKASTYDFYRSLEKLTDNTGLATPKSRYRALFRTIMQWRHLKMLKWGGRAHDVTGVAGTAAGELAVLCPSCPRPGVNLPEGWEDAPVGSRFLYMMFLAVDANFRLKNQLVSNYSQDPGLGTGWAYLVPREPYERYVFSRANDADISTCVGLQALAKASTKFSRGLRHTGVGGVFCGRSEMFLPLGVGNLQKGERYANMDYIVGSVIHFLQLLVILISYDIACQWFVNLFHRMEHWPREIRIPATTQLVPAIPKLHEPMHGKANHEVYSLNFIRGVGLSDMETPERIWSAHNPLGNATKTQGPGSRQDVLDDHFGFWNWCKYISLGATLMRKYKRSIAHRNIQIEGHRGLTAALDSALVTSWEVLCDEWETDTSLPRKGTNPFQTDEITLTEAQVKKDLAEEEEQRLQDGGISLHEITASSFVAGGLELEEFQRRVRRLAKATPAGSTARQEGGLTEQRNLLRSRLRAWERLLPLYMPGLLQYQADLSHSTLPLTLSNHPEDADVWLPSCLPAQRREQICVPGLSSCEERLRVGQAHDALDSVRHILKVKSRLVLFKNKNVRGQRDGTRSRAVIDRVHENAKVAAEKYRACRQAKLALSGPGEWEGTLRVLADGDIRSYQDPNHLRPCQGRKGTLDDDQVMERERQGLLQPDAPPDDVDINLLYHPRDRRDGTGETRRTLSWIWITNSDNPEDTSDNILRAEWAKSRARAARAKEEVLLLREEMRRVIAFLQWKASWWRKRENTRVGIGEDLTEALRSYAREQADLQTKLADRFCTIWKKPLDDLEIVEGADGEDQGEDDDENESGEDEDEAPEGLDEDPDDEDDDMTGPP